jgi:purine-binding chemotaxis protein CheW
MLANAATAAPRALQLADKRDEVIAMVAAELPREPVQCVIFRAGGCRHALPIDAVREILMPGSLTPAPGAPADILGLVQVRGAALPVIDLARRLKLGGAAATPDRRLVVVIAGGETAALLVDDVDEVATVPPTDFELVHLPGGDAHLVLKRHDALVGWLDPSAIIAASYGDEALAA